VSFSFRKSLKVGPFRVNFSKSGIGLSTGVKGFRVGTGPRGNYMSAGRGGLYYRKNFSAAKHLAPTETLSEFAKRSADMGVDALDQNRPMKIRWPVLAIASAAICWILFLIGVARDDIGTFAAIMALVCFGMALYNRRKRSHSAEEIFTAEPLGQQPAAITEMIEDSHTRQPFIVDRTQLPSSPKREKLSLAQLRGNVGKQPAGFASKAWNAENYTLPGYDLLDLNDSEGRTAVDPAELEQFQQVLIETMGQFGIAVAAGDITKGPTITRYEVYPAKGVRLERIVALERELARATRTERINILAPIPGKDTVGIELANPRRLKVTLRELLQSQDWEDAKTETNIPIALGKDIYGKVVIADLAKAAHLLIAGMTGSGKSACLDGIIASLLFHFTPQELRFIMIDSKVIAMQVYSALPHMALPVVTDSRKNLLALRWVIDEMEKRYRVFAQAGVRDIASFNGRDRARSSNEYGAEKEELAIPDRMPIIIVIVDELADLIQATPDFETALERIAQISSDAGIHLLLSSRSPLPIFSGILKASIPSRIAFQVRSEAESYSILDQKGADRLLGQGDMLYLPPSTSRLIRAQGVLVTDDEIHRLVEFVSAQSPPTFDLAMQDKLELSAATAEEVTDEDEELVEKCLEIIRQEKRASTSLLQRRLRLGYTRAARIVDILEQRGILGPGEGAKPREILVDLDAAV
jgi:S-DNA-T family DNA segregation ATPase FtsK/SpoIIIE